MFILKILSLLTDNEGITDVYRPTSKILAKLAKALGNGDKYFKVTSGRLLSIISDKITL